MYKNVHVSYLLMLKKSEQLLIKFKASWDLFDLYMVILKGYNQTKL